MQYSKTQKIVKSHVLILKLINKLDLTIGQKTIVLSNLSIYYTWKTVTITINLNYQHQHGMINLYYLMDHILYQISRLF